MKGKAIKRGIFQQPRKHLNEPIMFIAKITASNESSNENKILLMKGFGNGAFVLAKSVIFLSFFQVGDIKVYRELRFMTSVSLYHTETWWLLFLP